MQPLPAAAPPSVDVAIGRRITDRRIALGLSAHDLAGQLALSVDDLAAFERGDRTMSAATLRAFAKALDTSAAALMGELGAGEGFLLGLSDPDVVAMLQAFAAITAPDVRAAILSLVQEMAKDGDFRAV